MQYNLRKLSFAAMILLPLICLIAQACNGQQSPAKEKEREGKPVSARSTNTLVGGGCDGCELMYIGMPASPGAIDTSAGWKEKGTPLIIAGTVVKRDGKTPAPGVIIYYWQTDNNGYYSAAPGIDERVKRHGHIRGWVRTDAGGRYTIYTIRPAPYPGEAMPAHIHLSVREPGLPNEYYTDEINFDDDPLLTQPLRNKLEKRGGNAVVKTEKRDGREYTRHRIVLGLNIPGYPD